MKPIRKIICFVLSAAMIFSMIRGGFVHVHAEDVLTWKQLQEQINNDNTAVITLGSDVTAEEADKGITIADGKDITIDLNGYTLSRGLIEEKENGFVIKIEKGGSLTITDSANGNGVITGGYTKNGAGIYNSGTLVITGGKIKENLASEKGGAVYNDGSLTISAGSLIKNSAKEGGGIYNAAEGIVFLEGSAEISENKTSGNGGGGIADYGTLSISDDVRIIGNFAYTNGGGILVENGGSLEMSSGTVSGNNAYQTGSGILHNGSFSINGDPVIQDNTGDDVYLPRGKTITVSGALWNGARIGVTAHDPKAYITNDYGKYNSDDPSDYFFENGKDVLDPVLDDRDVKLATEGLVYVKRYWDEDAQLANREIGHLADYIVVDGSVSSLESGRWYAVTADTTLNQRISANDEANLILCDGVKLNARKGIRVTNAGTLNVYSGPAGSGQLYAQTDQQNKAGIGGDNGETPYAINIHGGDIEAIGYDSDTLTESAGIGGGRGGGSGHITIYGGTIVARGRTGIGGGTSSAYSEENHIVIYGGDVRAYCSSSTAGCGAGIGGGHNAQNGPIDILGGRITAWGQGGAGIGAGKNKSQGGDINISNCHVYAEATYAAAIGGGEGGNATVINITNSSVEAVCYEDSEAGIKGGFGAGIGGGKGGRSGSITILNSIVGGSSNKGAGIGGGEGGAAETILIIDSCVIGRGTGGGAGIGGGDGKSGGSITIRNSNVLGLSKNEKSDYGFYKTIQKQLYNAAVSAMMSYDYGSVAFFNAGSLLVQFMILLFAPNHSGAAIGGGDSADSGTILIENSNVTATAGNYAAAIGGGDDGNFEQILIRNSTVEAKSGKYGAGIGSGDMAGDGNGEIVITASTVTATSGAEGAGIGSGNRSNNGMVTITDSVVTATGGSYAAGIGGGDAGNGGTINITRSTVTATGGKDGAGIGGGEDGDGGNITITSSNVVAKGGRWGAGIGTGEYGYKTTIKILGESTVEAISGGSGDSEAIGSGDYFYKSAQTGLYLDEALIVYAGDDKDSTSPFTGNDRYDAVGSHKYARLVPCAHDDPSQIVWVSVNTYAHVKHCNICGCHLGVFEDHQWGPDDQCTVCGVSATHTTVTLIEKNEAGEEVRTVNSDLLQHSDYTIPECEHVPAGYQFVAWFDTGFEHHYIPGDLCEADSTTLEAIYMPVAETSYIDQEGNEQTVIARQITDSHSSYLTSGWYVADSDLTMEHALMTRGKINLILADGKTLSLFPAENNPLVAYEKASLLAVYGQAGQSGVLNGSNKNTRLGDMIQYGGTVSGFRALQATGAIEILGGTVDVSILSAAKGAAVKGGTTKTDTLLSGTANTLGWSDPEDSITIGSFVLTSGGSVSIAENQALTDGTNVYTGTLSSDDLNKAKGKTLTPSMIHTFGEPEWTWYADHARASALFRCLDEGCDYQAEIDAEVSSEEDSEGTLYTAKVVFLGTEYTDTQHSERKYFVSRSVSLGGAIGMNFYIDLTDEEIAEGAVVRFRWMVNEKEKTQSVALTPDDKADSGYKAACTVSAAEMTAPITAVLEIGGTETASTEISVRQYAQYLLEHAYNEDGSEKEPAYAKAVPLVKAMLNYGAYSQLQFKVNQDDLANNILSEEERDPGEVTIEIADPVVKNLPEGISLAGATVSLQSETTLSLYFESSEAPEFTCGNYKVETIKTDKYYIARICGIKAKCIGDILTVTVNGSGTVSYSILNYCKYVLQDDTQPADLQNVVKALCQYWRETVEYEKVKGK